MTYKERRADALAHFGLTEADIVETMRVHVTALGGRHHVFPMHYCFTCQRPFSGEDTERVVMRAGRIVVRVDGED